jgi:predicted dehydrogenase
LDLAIIGLGSWGRRLIDSVQGRSDQVRFAAAVTRTPAKVDEFTAAHGVSLSDDFDSVLTDPAIGGVVVAGPAGLHADHGLQALRAGKPVLAIKPMALKAADAEAMRAAAEEAGVLLAMGYNRCFIPPIQELRRRIAAGSLGKLLHAEGDFCVDRYFKYTADDWKADIEQSPPGALADHMLYSMIEFLGPITRVNTDGCRQVVDVSLADTATVQLRFASGATGLLTAIGVTAPFTRFHVFGTKGWAEVRGNSDFNFMPVEGEAEKLTFPPFDAERAELEAFAGAVSGEKSFPVTPDDAVHGVAVIEAMANSAAHGEAVSLA